MLEQMRGCGEVVSFQDAFSRGMDCWIDQDLVCITFDDGFREHREVVLPLLESLGTRATFFISSAYHSEEPLVRPLDYLYYLQNAVAESGRCTNWFLDVLATTTGFERAPGVSAASHLRGKTWGDVGPSLEAVGRELGVRVSAEELRDKLYLTEADLRRIALSGMEIGAHGESHRSLGDLTVSEQQREIASSLSFARLVTQRSDVPFAYPFGGEASFSDDTVNLCCELGALCACTSREGSNGQQSDRYRLARVDVNRTRMGQQGSIIYGNSKA
jgi:peptidoglycan/xylan/chitin deacetylase (PgdA/CDA1 family)